MEEPLFKTISSHGPAPDQWRQTIRRANSNGFFASWRRKYTDGSGHVTESVGVGQPGHNSDVARTSEATTSFPCTTRALVSSVSFGEIRGLNIRSTQTSPLPPASIDTASESLQPELATLPSSATTSTSSSPNVDRASINSMSQSSDDADEEPVPIASVPSPSIHPDFAAFLEEAALGETARTLAAENDAASANSSWPSSPYRSATASPTSSRLGLGTPPYLEADCDHHVCILAAQWIKTLYLLKRANVVDHSTRQLVDRVVIAGYRVLSDCEHRRTIALVGNVVAAIQTIGDSYAPGLLGTVYNLLQSSGIHPSMVPALAGPGAPGPQRQDVHAGAE